MILYEQKKYDFVGNDVLFRKPLDTGSSIRRMDSGISERRDGWCRTNLKMEEEEQEVGEKAHVALSSILQHTFWSGIMPFPCSGVR